MNLNYDKSEENYLNGLSNESRRMIVETWLTNNTLDFWRHEQMLAPVKNLIEINSNWLTVGDGRYGTDANFVITNGGSAHASDLTDVLLSIGSQTGFVNDFSKQNAENLDFPNN